MVGKMKIKMILTKEYLEKKSDYNNPICADEILKMLEENGIVIERKSVYADVKQLKAIGQDIKLVRRPDVGYYVRSRTFSLTDIAILRDLIKNSDAITAEKTEDLLKKLGTLCSEYQYGIISNKILNESEVIKADNDILWDNMAASIEALEYNKKMIIICNGKKSYVLPYGFYSNEGTYILIGKNVNTDSIVEFNLSEITSITYSKEKLSPESRVDFDIKSYLENK